MPRNLSPYEEEEVDFREGVISYAGSIPLSIFALIYWTIVEIVRWHDDTSGHNGEDPSMKNASSR